MLEFFGWITMMIICLLLKDRDLCESIVTDKWKSYFKSRANKKIYDSDLKFYVAIEDAEHNNNLDRTLYKVTKMQNSCTQSEKWRAHVFSLNITMLFVTFHACVSHYEISMPEFVIDLDGKESLRFLFFYFWNLNKINQIWK